MSAFAAPTMSSSDSAPIAFRGTLHKDLFPLAVRMVLFLAFFGNTLDIESVNDPTVGINFQAAYKAVLVLAAGILGAIGWWRLAAVRRLQQTVVGTLSIVLGTLYFLAIPTSVDKSVSLVGAVAFNSYVLLVMTALVLHGAKRIFYDALVALFLFLCLAWFIYLFVPSIGVYMEAAGAHAEVARMQGVGHPNAIGRSGSMMAIILVAGYRQREYRLLITMLGVAFALSTVWASLSRTAMVACLISLMIFNRDWLRSRLFLLAIGPMILLGICSLLYIDTQFGLDRVVNDILVGTSKTGDADEITSATGRTAIWAESWRLIMEKPILGYGSGTSPLLLEDFSHQTHNIMLNPMLSMGLFAGVVVGIWLLINLKWAFTTKVHMISAVCVFTMISGLTENTILPTYPETCTLSWLLVSFWPYLEFATAKAKSSAAVPSSPAFA